MTEKGIHTLVVSWIDYRSSPPEVELAVEGGHNGECEVWEVCAECKDEVPAWNREDGVKEYVRDGVLHKWIEHGWMVKTNECAAYEGWAYNELHDIALVRGVGRWPVEISYWGDGMWEAYDLTKENK